jgi:hypothetical protein
MPARMDERQVTRSVLARASLLDSNMNSAFNSKLHTGAMSIPMQFQAYEIRMAEAMYGNALTRGEKARLFAANSALYGLRGGYFAVLGLPVGDWLVRKLQDSGYMPGENGLIDVIVHGFPSWAMAMITGDWTDFSKWGNRGIDTIDSVFENDKSLAQIASGLVGNTMVNAWENSTGLRRDLWSMMKGDGQFELTGDDIIQTFKTLSLVTDIDKSWLAFQTGKLYTRNGTKVTDIDKFQSVLMTITGLEPLKGKDIWARQQSIKENEENFRKLERQYAVEYERALRDGDNDYVAGYDLHMKQAGGILHLLPPTIWKQTHWMKQRNDPASYQRSMSK